MDNLAYLNHHLKTSNNFFLNLEDLFTFSLFILKFTHEMARKRIIFDNGLFKSKSRFVVIPRFLP